VHPVFLTLLTHIFYFGIGLLIISKEQGSFVNFFIFAVAMFFFTLGAIVCAQFFRVKPKDFLVDFRANEFSDVASPSGLSIFFLWVCGLPSYLYLINKIGIPIMTEDMDIRYKVTGLSNSVFELFWPVACVALYAKTVRSKSWKTGVVTFLLTLVTAVLYSLLGHRYASLQLLLTLFIAYSFLRNKPAGLGTYLRWIAIFAGIFVGVQYLRSYAGGTPLDPNLLVDITTRRLFLVGSRTLNFIFNNFPDSYDFYYGLTYIRRIRNLVHFDDKMPSIGYFLYQGVTGHKTPGYDPVSLLGEFYINFGLFGIIGGMTLYGFFLELFFLKTLASKTVSRLSFFCVGTMLFARTFAYSFPGTVFNFIVIFSAFALLLLLNPTPTYPKRGTYRGEKISGVPHTRNGLEGGSERP
jgi:oligosaccharide repeat unit polymerase